MPCGFWPLWLLALVIVRTYWLCSLATPPAGHFLCVFADCWIFKNIPGAYFFFLNRSYVNSSVYFVVHFSGRKHASRKTAYLANQTYESSAVCLEEKKAYIHGNLFGTTGKPIRRILQPEKCLSDERDK